MGAASSPAPNPHRLREHLLAADRDARVFRELWSCNGASYLAHRRYISYLKSSSTFQRPTSASQRSPGSFSGYSATAAATAFTRGATGVAADHGGGGAGHGTPRASSASLQLHAAARGEVTEAAAQAAAAHAAAAAAAEPSAGYSFEGVSHVFDLSRSPITAIAFAKVRNDLLAFSNATGELWIARMEAGKEVQTTQAQRIHRRAIACLDWSFDNSQLLTCAEDGALCVWRASDGTCIRSILDFRHAVPMLCCRLHPLNGTLALVGTAAGWVEVYNCSAGKVQLRYNVAGTWDRDLQVTALEVDNHSVYVGDSTGHIHLYRAHMSGTALTRLSWSCKLKAASNASSPLVRIIVIPFCRVLDAPAIVTYCCDSTLSLIKAGDVPGAAELLALPYLRFLEPYLARVLPPSTSLIHPAVCPLSAIQQLPLVTVGGEDGSVRIYDISPARGAHPFALQALQGHGAPVTDVAWSFDEAKLASADTAGTVILWLRSGRGGSV